MSTQLKKNDRLLVANRGAINRKGASWVTLDKKKIITVQKLKLEYLTK